MDTTELKQIVARHFDYAPSGQGQYLHGDWFTPKHKDSLQYTLEEIGNPDSEAQEEIEELEDEIEDLKAQIEELKKDEVEV